MITLRAKVEARKKRNFVAFILEVAREDFVSFFYKVNLSCLQRKHGGREGVPAPQNKASGEASARSWNHVHFLWVKMHQKQGWTCVLGGFL